MFCVKDASAAPPREQIAKLRPRDPDHNAWQLRCAGVDRGVAGCWCAVRAEHQHLHHCRLSLQTYNAMYIRFPPFARRSPKNIPLAPADFIWHLFLLGLKMPIHIQGRYLTICLLFNLFLKVYVSILGPKVSIINTVCERCHFFVIRADSMCCNHMFSIYPFWREMHANHVTVNSHFIVCCVPPSYFLHSFCFDKEPQFFLSKTKLFIPTKHI